METIRVGLSAHAYDIMVGNECLRDLGQTLQQRGLTADVIVFTSPRIGRLYYKKLDAGLREAGFTHIGRYDIPDGEEHKNEAEWNKALTALNDFCPSPGSLPLVLGLGGGVVGDLGGFAAGTFRRGVPYVQVPTTLLADVDCGVGGKVGVNFSGVKNLVGMFYQPKLVYADLALLSTLDGREVRSGIAEIIKYAAVCSRELFEYLEKNMTALVGLDRGVVEHVVRDCYRIKARVVVEDERDDLGKRVVLNFGHTIGHALEMAAGYGMTHGEAVAVGMVAATNIAVRLKVCRQAFLERLVNLITAAGLPVSAGGINAEADDVVKIMRHDKKFINGMNRFVLPVDCGDWCEREGIKDNIVREVIETVALAT